jgi:putative PEP-CTERM system TPR-repeat lipoprotein
LEIKPDLAEAQRGLTVLLLESRRYEDAITIARRAQSQQPKEAMGYVLEGDVNAARKDWDAAAKAYRTGLQQVQAPILAIRLHTALVESGKKADADRYAATWTSAHPNDPNFLSYLGDAALSRKDYEAAERSYLAALKQQPRNAVALNNLAWIRLQTGGKDAFDYAQRANALIPNHPAFMDTLATILSARGEHARAIELQQKALGLQPDNAGMKLDLARIYIAAGDKTKARNELEALTRLDPKQPQRTEASALLSTL